MEYEKIRKLMEDMGNSKLSEIDIDFPDGTKISMKKAVSEVKTVQNIEVVPVENISTNVITKEENVSDDVKVIKSPMVGTFYLKPSPTSEAYVQKGKKIKKGDTVCIIEAMKLMNEIESEFDGEIVEIYVNDGEPVEYGTKLFGIK